MKITIDLKDPELRAHLEREIDNRLNEMAAERIQGVIEEILKTKMERLTPEWLDKLASLAIKEKVKDFFGVASWGRPTEFQNMVAEITKKMIKDSLR